MCAVRLCMYEYITFVVAIFSARLLDVAFGRTHKEKPIFLQAGARASVVKQFSSYNTYSIKILIYFVRAPSFSLMLLSITHIANYI